MLKNTNYSVLAQGGVYFAFKEKPDLIGWFLAVILIVGIWTVSMYILGSNRNSIDSLRKKEADIIEGVPFPVIEKNWAGRKKPTEPDNRYFNIYRGFIFGTGLILLLNLTRQNTEVRTAACELFCPKSPTAIKAEITKP